ncbi:MAG: aminopeptidase P family protein [Phycisphaerales bacterium]|nr:aminopeptidase P family protein [Phycisphaerales bacterium]
MAKGQIKQAPDHIAARLKICRAGMESAGLDGYLVTARADQYYLTGFDGEDGAALILPKTVYLLTDGRFEEEAGLVAAWARAIVRRAGLPEVIGKVARKHRLKRLGFQSEALTVRGHTAIRQALGTTKLRPAPPLTREQRQIKDEIELAAMRKAIAVAEGAFKAAVKRLRPGMTEREWAALLLHEMLRRGAEGAAFPTIVAEGANSSLPHARPGNRKIERGSAVLVDWGALVDHYRSDLTRMIYVRRIPPRFRVMHEQVLAAQQAALEALRTGVRMSDVDARARQSLRLAGLAQRFTHSLGHGLGLDVHEEPRLAPRCRESLKTGMLVTVEPGVYVPGVGGVRIEDDVRVTEAGAELLSTLERSPEAFVAQ